MTQTIRTLLVEDNDLDAQFLTALLERSTELTFEVDRATSVRAAVVVLHNGEFDIMLVDLGLPDNSGLELIPRLRAASPSTPIVMLTGDDNPETALQAIETGAQDYLPKQHIVGQLLTRVVCHSIARQKQLLKAQSEALTEPLTGIGNRRAMDLELERRLADFRRHSSPFCVSIFDIDFFKRVNDQLGHDAGDRVLRSAARALAESTRETDRVARYGGEEFAVLLPMTELADACTVVESLRCRLGEAAGRADERLESVTASAGVTEVQAGDDSLSVFRRADEALYAAKGNGRDRSFAHDGTNLVECERRQLTP
ncbi:MAG: diguanylate cyclase [Planctomycetota bacterium]